MNPLPLVPVEIDAFGLRLRPWAADEGGEAAALDAEAVRHGLSDPDFRRWNAASAVLPGEHAEWRWLRDRAEKWADGSAAGFAVTEPDGKRLGHIGVTLMSREMRCARVGYWVLPEARGAGVASRALEAATRWAFEGMDLHRIELGHALGHDASCRVAGHCGYALEGVARGALFGSDREPLDIHAHARLAGDPLPERFSGLRMSVPRPTLPA